MAFVSRSRLIGLVLAATVAWLPIAPPEHVHEADEHGHHHVLVHRHVAGHGFSQGQVHHDGVLGDDDAPILTFDTVYTVPAALTILGEPPSDAAVVVEPPADTVTSHIPGYHSRPIHGPPRAPTGLRAPPLLSRL
jgi:hypothetical protein